MMAIRAKSASSLAAVTVPWNAFVGAFLYYVVLTALVIGGVDFSALAVIAAYVLPVAAYVAVVLTRGLRALAALPVEVFHTPEALQH